MIKIEHVEKLNITPHYMLVRLAFIELHEAGFLSRNNSNALNYDLEAIVATQDDVPAGFLAFGIEKWNQTVDIHMAYVKPEFRKQGIHTAMFEKLIEYGKSKQAVRIDTTAHVENIPVQKAFEKQGRRHRFNTYSYPLVDWIMPE